VLLFERTNRRVELTDIGELVLAEARTTLRSAQATRSAANRARRGDTGTVRLGFVASAAFLRLPELLRAARAAVPHVEFELLRLNTADQLDALAADRIDLGLARTPPATPHDETGTMALEPEPMMAIVGVDHRLAARPTIEVDALAEDPWILSARPRSSRSAVIDHITQMCASAGFAPRVAHLAPDLPSVLGPVAGGLGVSLVPIGIAQLSTLGLASVTLAKRAQRPLPTTLLWHTNRRRPVVQRIIDAAHLSPKLQDP
jgi:DNA-binding transcriptional LysR family regulator